MAIFPQQSHMTVEEYFELCRSDPDTRYEYIDGQVTMLAGNHTMMSNKEALFKLFLPIPTLSFILFLSKILLTIVGALITIKEEMAL